jgi:phosphonate transport system permease protein
MDNAMILVRRQLQPQDPRHPRQPTGAITYVVEGERRAAIPRGTRPDWVAGDGDGASIDLGDGHLVAFLPDNRVTYDVPGFGQIALQVVDDTVTTNLTDPMRPDWINASDARVAITTEAGRLTATRLEIRGLPLFLRLGAVLVHARQPLSRGLLLADRLRPPDRPRPANLAGAWQDFWNNPIWRHKDVFWAMGETVLMAFLGTMTAASSPCRSPSSPRATSPRSGRCASPCAACSTSCAASTG